MGITHDLLVEAISKLGEEFVGLKIKEAIFAMGPLKAPRHALFFVEYYWALYL